MRVVMTEFVTSSQGERVAYDLRGSGPALVIALVIARVIVAGADGPGRP